MGQNLFWKNRFWVGRDGGQKPGGTSSIWEGHKFVGGAFPFLGTKIFLLVQFFFVNKFSNFEKETSHF